MNFYERLLQETESVRQQLYQVRQLSHALSGQISLETYRAYLHEAFHHVSHTVPLLMQMGAKLPTSKKWLYHAIIEYQSEEAGHEEWILNDITAAGGDAEQARHSKPNLATQLMIAYNYDYINRHNPIGFFGMIFMLESTSIALANTGAHSLMQSLQLPKKAFSYLLSHGSLDIEHMHFYEKTVNKITDPIDQAAIIEVAQNAFQLFAQMLSAIPETGARTNAA